jgi:hypothetical protein
MASGHERVLVIRVWCEPGRDPSFRGRVVSFDRPGEPAEHLGVTTSPEVVETWVRRWLREGRAEER